ncbi:MAG: M48 family metalloprotease [Rhodoplanes sp.]|uniref:M48 family metalloprotease n=1 Tax=Rhodoplanes sp. TaxID=1968906 RepID=UPI0017CB5A62|nr:M48 family metalloprotease [Rhodoplanes sp.]NVO12833.1 M48 family metalloprotease [Rhodoplanes sp.]
MGSESVTSVGHRGSLRFGWRAAAWRRAAVLALALALPALAGCSSWISTLDQTGGIPEPRRTTEQLTPAQREHRRILASYGGAYKDARLEAMIASMVDRLVAASERPELHYKVTILNSPAINAFALPTGDLYVTRGLIGLANDGSELASVLAHEMAHVLARHAAIREDQARRVAIAGAAAADPSDTTGALAIAKTKLALASFSRAQEFEADGIGVGIAARSGYDPHGAPRILGAMGRFAGLRSASGADPRSLDFLSSHPATPERIENALANANSQPVSGERDRAEFLAAVDGLVYGEDPIEGFVRGRRFLHPKLGFAFTAPEGFTLENTAQAVLGSRDGGDQALRLDIVRPPAEQTLADYLNAGWIDNIEPGSVEETTAGGFPAVTAAAKGDPWWFRVVVIKNGADVYRFVYASKTRSAEVDRAFRESANSIRRLSLAEARNAKPLRLRIVTVRPGDTVEKLAGRMALIDRQVERFRVLNGLSATDAPKAGDKVKLVVE